MTLSDLRLNVTRPVDMQDENFMPDAELNASINLGIKQAEAEILGIYENYFLDTYPIPLTSGISVYDLPSDIYAAKIVRLTYNNDVDKYIVNRIRDIDVIPFIEDNELYSYYIINPSDKLVGTAVSTYVVGTKTLTFSGSHFLSVGDKINIYSSASIIRGTDYVASVTNSSTVVLRNGIAACIPTDLCRKSSGMKIELHPSSREDSTNNLVMKYIRRAKQLVNDSDVLDIPEFENFVILFARYECLKKEIGNPLLQITKAELEAERKLMVDTLTQMVPDSDNEIAPDLRFYNDFYGHLQGYRGEY